LGVLIFSGLLPYYFLAFSDSCAQQCSESGNTRSQCLNFPGVWQLGENLCGDGGVDIGMASDCRTPPNHIGGSKGCCCYN